MAAVPQLVVAREVDIDFDAKVNIEIDFDQDEAEEILGFMDKYHLPTYADAVKLMAMLGAGAVATSDPTSPAFRAIVRGTLLLIALVTGAVIDHDFGW